MWAMHPRNAPSAADGFSPLTHGTPNTAVVWPPATSVDGRADKLAIYTRRMNTILQSTRRGKLDEETAAAMKKLAKDKMLRALSDQRYASTVYEQEMTQQALLEAVQKK